MNFSYLNPYNAEFFHPLFGTLLPLTLLLFFSSFLKNITQKSFFLTLLVFGIIDFIVLSGIETTCSQIGCYDRNASALILSSLFSIVYFIILWLKSRKQSTLD